MELKNILSKRRSIRKFSDKPINEQVVNNIVDATLSAPSSRNSRSTNLIVIRNREIIEKIATMRDYGSAFVKNAPMVILVAGDTSKSDLWEVNCSISATTLQLACVDEGLASCWVHVKDRPQKQAEPDGAKAIELIREVVDFPAEYDVLCAIALGYSDFEPAALPPFDKEKQIINIF